jgi:hypothetical protein
MSSYGSAARAGDCAPCRARRVFLPSFELVGVSVLGVTQAVVVQEVVAALMAEAEEALRAA